MTVTTNIYQTCRPFILFVQCWQVWKIEDFLSKWEAVALPAAGAAGPVLPGGSTAAGSGAAGEPDAAAEAIAAVLLREIDSYR